MRRLERDLVSAVRHELDIGIHDLCVGGRNGFRVGDNQTDPHGVSLSCQKGFYLTLDCTFGP